MLENYLTVNEIALRLKANPETVRRWIRDGKLKSIQNSRKEGNLIKESDLEEFLIANKKYRKNNIQTVTKNAEILKSIEFHKSEIRRLEKLLEKD